MREIIFNAEGGFVETEVEAPRYPRRIYQLTEKDRARAAGNLDRWTARLSEIEMHRGDKSYWKKRHTTFGLAKRDAARNALRGHADFSEGRGQGLLDQIASAGTGVGYTDERRSSAYNFGYYEGFRGSRRELAGYIATNHNFDFLREQPTVTAAPAVTLDEKLISLS